ncbi:MAG: hypothetical protein ACOYUZ_02165 [Patescibacteria group bacterium]
MKKLVILMLGVSFFALSAVVVKAQTYQGPPSGCNDPSQTGCNVPGVIWNKNPKAGGVVAQDAGFYITGDARTTGDFRIGAGLRVDANGANITGNVNVNGDSNAGNGIIIMRSNGDLQMTDGKAIRVDQAGASTLNIGNWVPGSNPVNVNILGTLNMQGNGTWNNPQISTPRLCLNGDCRNSWPTTGGGGDITDVLGYDGIIVDNSSGPQPSARLDISYTDDRYWQKHWGISNSAGIFSVTGQLGSTDSSGSNSNYPYVNIGGAYIGYYQNLGYWSVSPPIRFNNVSTFNNNAYMNYNLDVFGTTRLGIYGGSQWLLNLQPAGALVNSSGSWTHTGAFSASGNITSNGGSVGGTSVCIGSDCRAAWPAGGGGDITAVAAGTGLSGGGTSGDVSLSITTPYALPQSCTPNYIPKWNGSSWQCAPDADTDSGGDITGVTAGTGLTGGGTSGAVQLDIQQYYRLPQSCGYYSVPKWNGSFWICETDQDTNSGGDITGVTAGTGLTGGGTSGAVTLTIGQNFLLPTGCASGQLPKWNTAVSQWQCSNDIDTNSGGDITAITVSGGLFGGGTANDVNLRVGAGTGISVGANTVALDTGYTDSRYVNSAGDDSMSGLLNLRSSGVGAGTVALQVAGAEALWYNGSRMSWGYGGTENYFADKIYSDNDISSGNNKYGTSGTNYSLAPCTFRGTTNEFDAGSTRRNGCFNGEFMAGIEFNEASPYRIVGVWCCPL